MLFRDINYYLDQAKVKNSISSDSKLCAALGYKGRMTTYLRKGQTLPSPDKMIDLAALAGIDEETALIDLGMWSTRGKAREAYASILQKITQVTAMIIALIGFTIAPTPSHASQNIDVMCKTNCASMFLMESFGLLRHLGRWFKSLFLNKFNQCVISL